MNQLFNIFKVDSAKASRIMASFLCISAHWKTKGTYVTTMQNPPTIHDFGGFPKALFEVRYTAPGSPDLALKVISAFNSFSRELTAFIIFSGT
jgi:aromatic ring-opening dioxygenase catalytic subunit (LigB family)